MPSRLQAKLLLVDDDEALAEMYALQLTASGFQVTTARSGAEALQLVLDATPDLIYLDLGLPGMTGLEVMKPRQELGAQDYLIKVDTSPALLAAAAHKWAGRSSD